MKRIGPDGEEISADETIRALTVVASEEPHGWTPSLPRIVILDAGGTWAEVGGVGLPFL